MSRDMEAEAFHANVMAWAHAPFGAFAIWCTECRGERPALKVQRHDGRLAGWWNRCCTCSTMFPALPPRAAKVRHQRRMYEKRSGQLRLGGASR